LENNYKKNVINKKGLYLFDTEEDEFTPEEWIKKC